MYFALSPMQLHQRRPLPPSRAHASSPWKSGGPQLKSHNIEAFGDREISWWVENSREERKSHSGRWFGIVSGSSF
ncbi:unnamed protein product [Sphagnum jensenii]|uniref:Uncharacterized protein n=1 Tax=Sphagnum jensenii TaxID=128206 RepID=A0ABP0WCK6_9BRYO